MGKKILVTGGRGFIGRHLVGTLQDLGYDVNVFDIADGDIATTSELGEGIDYVFHLAGKTGVPASWEDPTEFYRVNVMGTVNVLEFCRRHRIPMTYLNTYVYGRPGALPIDEVAPVHPNSPYNHSKYVGEEIIKFYTEVYGLRATVLRAFNIYGYGLKAPFLMPLIIDMVRDASVEEVHLKTFAPKRDFVYIDDVVDALVKSMVAPNKFNVYNIGSGTSVDCGEVVRLILKLMGSAKPCGEGGEIRQNEVMDVRADISKARREIGWEPKVDLEEGLKRMIAEYK